LWVPEVLVHRAPIKTPIKVAKKAAILHLIMLPYWVGALDGTEELVHILTMPIAQAEPMALAARLTAQDKQAEEELHCLLQVEHIMEIELVALV
jgi:hypothetical protein